jgi:RNA polymerase sigma-70 factor (ECF subfamily)
MKTSELDFERIWNQYYGRLMVYSWSFSGICEEEREECVQEIFLKLYQKRDAYDSTWSISTWIYRIARNYFIDLQRKKRVRNVLFLRNLPEGMVDTIASNLDREEEQMIARMDIGRALINLPPGDREVLHLHYAESMTVHEISSVLGKPEGTVKTSLRRARIGMKSQLGEACGYIPKR